MRNEQRLHPALPQPRLTAGGRILLIDDDSKDLRYYCAILQQQGYSVWAVSSHKEGSESVWNLDPDLIIVSQGSLAFEGQAVLKSAVARNRNIPVVVLTRCIVMNCYLEAMQLGAVDYLEKPREAVKFLEMVRRHLRPSVATVRTGVGRLAGRTSLENAASQDLASAER